MDKPARVTRKEAIVSGGRWRNPIFAAMKLNAQITTTNPIDAAITARWGARPAEVSTYTDQASRSLRTVNFSMRSIRGVKPIPGSVGTRIVPCADTVTSGSMMSSCQ
jgi:hypothetical protein